MTKRLGKGKLFNNQKIEVLYWNGDVGSLPELSREDKAIFLDTSPPKKWLEKNQERIRIFDHHPTGEHPWEKESQEKWRHYYTATILVLKELGDLNDLKQQIIARASARFDYFRVTDSMLIGGKIMKDMNISYSDQEVQSWFSIIINSHFQEAKIDFEKGLDFFRKTVKELIEKESPAKEIFRNWISRKNPLEDKMSIATITSIILSTLGEEKTKEWLIMPLKAIEYAQMEFEKAEEIFGEKAEIVLAGRKLIAFLKLDEEESKNVKIPTFARSKEAKKYLPKNLKNTNEEPPIPILVLFQEFDDEVKGFQIFTNSAKYKLLDIAAGIRTVILKKRNKEIPTYWQELKQGGTLEGTAPFYYHKGTGPQSYEILLWGTPTKNKVKPVDISISEIKNTIHTTVDLNLPNDCRKKEKCIGIRCEFYPWRMHKCWKKRKNK